ncbi:hypothetical protein [Alkalibacillus haloalkaliphilus]|uniref:hypothetical protein n=1 Tax=Alkalibacillus haloalkaliphilus TaxID=94136 RepID=UPI002936C72B|nr:hypothetical protein [Alkalibacillus haloalkaliphilus]MDV2582306.1 hypothetical protein [Alkalibacillus haloalkaliphilus]
MFNQLYDFIMGNLLFVVLFLVMMISLYFLIKPLIQFWLSKQCLHTLTYWIASTTMFIIIVGYLYFTDHSIVSSATGMKELTLSLLIAVSGFGLCLMVYSVSKSLSQFIRNRNTTS